MPRKAGIDAPGEPHRIIVRGIERKAIFKDDTDRENFLDRLSAIVSESETGCYGWVLMTNHTYDFKDRSITGGDCDAKAANRLCS
jgi:hypothetical protein